MAELTRRDLLARAGLAAGALALGTMDEAEAAPDLRSWAGVRAQFALGRDRIHLVSFLLAAHPRPVRAAIERHRRGLDRNAVEYLYAKEGQLTAEVRAAAGRYLGVPPSEIALTDSTTMGLGLLYARLSLEAGDEVLTTEHDFYATHEALRLSGARIRRMRLYEDPRRASADEIVGRLRRAVTGRTRVVALTWVHSSTGVKLPLRQIAEALPQRVLLCVDGVHGFGAEAATVRELGCDAFVSGCHKWLYGPRGTGVLWGNARVRELLRPTIPSFDDGASYGAWLAGGTPTGLPDGARLTPGGFHSFEHRWALAEAFRFHEAIGRLRVQSRIRSLAARLKTRLEDLRGVRVRTPAGAGLSAGLVCFEVDGTDPDEVVRRLAARRIVGSVTPYAQRYVRLGPGIVNTPAEVDAAVRAIAAL
ncbi:MAG TPA: aminotransferase class V-fold PLP-dependent enzyme [Gaiellaceae bacterium]|nr:aminotransferase class V-fold PLP-dependent enzyme [Gaiellaceae bacterium]